ncbi:uncharacterized protein L3040_004727 [Drepanopeziza brunnea f. sp. 'multigermtubi']|uniref:Uncharacterized protein n=1 Tax=Marssonina brunnea f. sp. multigermtubi (strain MB_m1) TaxID=1072389 RepID=K1X027_MARBU|nr:uncharacterized protein MBM_03310 [Drepanopeziza brunnea f. sp. 'multigermtubi' MB_m1]EKD18317.1 hypothetical protein MBM_03310 [Drepanopeziza brunnea f. sp. 'multigermtubi' MB_m1]KAJ5042170.1 hypothetical protein L3040_004727 [Drepanopeziza brunnea f. sp. 'multigermtubi']
MDSFPRVHTFFSSISNRCLRMLCLKAHPPSKPIEISAPFNFKEGPAMQFPGYSEDDISLMREKALASTAIVEDGIFDSATRKVVPGTWGGSSSCELVERAVFNPRRVSKGVFTLSEG